jgi:hypothetical protein
MHSLTLYAQVLVPPLGEPVENVRKSIAGMPQLRLAEYNADHSLIFTHSAALASEIREFCRSHPVT